MYPRSKEFDDISWVYHDSEAYFSSFKGTVEKHPQFRPCAEMYLKKKKINTRYTRTGFPLNPFTSLNLFKGLVHPKMKILLLIAHPHFIPNP